MEIKVGNQTLKCDNARNFRTSKGEQLVLTQTSPDSYSSDLVLFKVNQDGSFQPLKKKHYVNFRTERSITKNDLVNNIGTHQNFTALNTNSEIAQAPCTIVLTSGRYSNVKFLDEYSKAVKIMGERVTQDSGFLKPVKDSKFLDMAITKNLRSDMGAFAKFCAEFGKLGNEVYVRVMKQLLSCLK